MHDTVLFDVDTQVDFMLPVGALYVPGAENLIPTFARLYEWARSRGFPVIASADAHAEQDPEFRDWPPHCVQGTLGQKKVAETLLPGAIEIPNRAGELPPGWQSAPQVIVEKQTLDVFHTATIEPVLAGRPARRYLVFGVVTEYCVRMAALGLLGRGRAVEVLTDATAFLKPEDGQKALEEIVAAGGRLSTTEAL